MSELTRFHNLPNDLVDRSIDLIEGDIRDLEVCREACDGVNYVIHQAALTSVPKSLSYRSVTNEVNVNGTLNYLLFTNDCG